MPAALRRHASGDGWADWIVGQSQRLGSRVNFDHSQLAQRFSQPTVTSGNRSICRAVVRGSMRRGGTLSVRPQTMVVRYHCLGKGEAKFTVAIPLGVHGPSFTHKTMQDAGRG